MQKVLFIHRDAEKEPPSKRHLEIREALKTAERSGCILPAVAVVPVRMLEAWLLFDVNAVRCAAGNPNGSAPLYLPPLKRLEDRPEPKKDLSDALKIASDLTGRRLKKFNTAQALWRIMDFVEDFTPLRELAAFRQFEQSVQQLSVNGWRAGFYGA